MRGSEVHGGSYAVVAGEERLGSGTVRSDADGIGVTYQVSNNGRGAHLEEWIRTDSDELPVSWTIDGKSDLGGSVAERMDTDGSSRSWVSQADEGRDPDGARKLYIAADCSPYAGWLYARAALGAGGSVDALPSGKVRASVSDQVRVGDTEVDVVTVTGASLFPQYLFADAGANLVASIGGGSTYREILVREDVVTQANTLSRVQAQVTADALEGIQQRVRNRYDGLVRIRNVRIFDPHEKRLTGPSSVTVWRGRFTRIEPGDTEPAGPGDTIIDGAGGTLVAGFHDMHVHLSAWSSLYYLAAGVTTVRDMGNDNQMLDELVGRIDAGVVAGPTVLRSGLIEARSPYSVRADVVAESLGEALAGVHWYADRGYHQIKLYNSIPAEWVAPLAAEAHRLGLRVVGHLPAFTTAHAMIEAGYDEITHLNQLMLGWLLEEGEDSRTMVRVTSMARGAGLDLSSEAVRRTIALMRERGIGLDATVGFMERVLRMRSRTGLEADAPFLSHMPVSFQRGRRRTWVPTTDEKELAAYHAAFATMLDLVTVVDGNGLDVWPGTDDEGTGFTYHRELELLVAAGLAPATVLRRATYDCARYLGLERDHGSVEYGKVASCVLLDGDPTVDIGAVRAVRMVMKDGDAYFPADIYRELGVEPFSPPPAVRRPTDEPASA
ncbi:hypothetical protein GCM10009836_42800 [Pseudonocardia ailaonensis]|uniref:Amidohydrolase-related domain-containing protein n=1 Tax=Pseudonocardia ailaonensis TaxID=367279 RepID=A0ABN2N8U0_9PSEU